jgi:PAS domain S-box-containing protein
MNTGAIPASTGGQPQDIHPRHRPADGTSASSFHGGPINILIVDDDPKNLTVLETVLDNPGYRLVRAESADQALLALVSEEFALLILDIRMPVMSGFELAQLIKERKKTARVPIIFLTAYYDDEDQYMLTGYSAGAVDYLHKPVNPAVLRSKVAVFADLHHKNRALLAEVVERRRAEEQLRELNATLEQRVTERTDALRESEERFRMVADNMSQLSWTCDLLGNVTWYNKRWLEYTGLTFEEMKGWDWKKVQHPDHVDRVVARVERSGEKGEPWEDTFPLRGLDGTYRWFLSRALPIRDAEGRIIRWFGTNTDITELREMQVSLRESEERLKKHTSALAEINKELESFSYSVSHDLRAPLRTIVAFNHILEEDHSPHLNDDARRCVTIVHKAAVEAGQLIDDLLEFSRLGRRDLTVHVVSMTDLAQEAADELKVFQEGRKIDMLVVDLPPCQGDRRLLKLVWTNLIENAVKYTKYRHEARIEVGWMPDDASAEAVTYYVKDDGVGFDMKYSHKLFGVFQRLHKKEDFDGTGVGLAIVQRIVQRHGGRVWAEGTVDGGATFFFSLRKATA